MWEAIRRNRRLSFYLIFLMAALLVGTGAAIGAAWWTWQAGAGVALGVWFLLTLFSWYGGPSMVLWASGVKRVTHADHAQLFNVVEEMTIASGLPLPEVYIINDTAPNAFATGRSPEKASVAVTTGLLDKLDRNELQGVIAHEMSHIRNRDTLYMTLVGIMVGTIVLICDIFLRATWYGAGRRRGGGGKKGGAQAIVMIIAIVFAILAPILSRLLYLAISRRREYLADASAVELTRYPEGLASALEKISGDKEVLEVANRATAHLYIVNPIKPFEERYAHMSSTHPPIAERVKILRRMASSPVASISHYEQTRRAVGAGPRRGILRKRSLKETAKRPVPLRNSSRTGTRTPEELRADLKRILGPRGILGGGLYFLLCACGAPVPVPGALAPDVGPARGAGPGAAALGVFQCTSCGRLHDTRKGVEGLKRLGPDGTVTDGAATDAGATAARTAAARPAAADAVPAKPQAAGSKTSGSKPARAKSPRSKTARFEEGATKPAPALPSRGEVGGALEPKKFDVDWADQVPAARGTWDHSEPLGPAPKGENPFGITFVKGEPVYPQEVTCPHCSEAIPVPAGFKGSRGPCPECRKMIVFFERG
ncbi:MAG: M48 family metallopeptidase [Planctomycetota bacterium]|jgi:heat shock protein HtpX